MSQRCNDDFQNCFQSLAFSQAYATFKQVISSKCLPTICILAGTCTFLSSFAGTNPMGKARAGCPVELKWHVLSNFPIVLLIFVIAESVSAGRGSAGVIVVGIMRTS